MQLADFELIADLGFACVNLGARRFAPAAWLSLPGHDLMITEPEAVAKLLLRLADLPTT